MANNQVSEFRRLSSDVTPTHYDLVIDPDIERSLFRGKVSIDLNVTKAASCIELHTIGLHLTSIEYLPLGCQERIACTSVSKDADEMVAIHLERAIEPGIGRLTIEFNGALTSPEAGNSGFYKSKCINRDATAGYAAVTQFEASYARRAFPCFDEPSLKATFDVTIVAKKTKTVLSNMPVKSMVECEQEPSRARFSFERTPAMSTYLLAFVVGEYDFVEARTTNGTLVRIYTPVGKSRLGEFSLDLTLKALEFFSSYFDLSYPLPKLDLIALSNVEIEAMENWGLLVFKESLVLIDPENYSVQIKAEVALTVSHEIAHQWFGNIVTMEWWTDLWLNEGFATWVEYLSVEHVLPEWRIWHFYANEHLLRALELDSLKSSHPIEMSVGAPSDLNQIFDSISYCKGSAVIRMLSDFVGAEAFARGLQTYLKKFAYSNARTADLWNELKEITAVDNNDARIDVPQLMHAWTRQAGYPVLNVSRRTNEDNGHCVLVVEQARFLRNQSSAANSSDERSSVVWNIPITVKTKSSHPLVHTRVLMTTERLEIDLGGCLVGEWMKLNADFIGFYRVNYSAELWTELLGHMASEGVSRFASTMDRLQLALDAFALCFAGTLSAHELLRFVWLFRSETGPYIWIALLKGLGTLMSLLLHSELYDAFRNFLVALLADLVAKLGFDIKNSDEDTQKLQHQNVLCMLAKLDDAAFRAFALTVYSNRANTKIQADLQKPVFTSVLRNADLTVVDEFVQAYDSSETPEEKERIAILLAQVTDPIAINHVLKLSLSTQMTIEEAVFMLCSVAQNSACKCSLDLVWTFVIENWKSIYTRYSDSVLLGRLLKPIIERFDSEEKIRRVEEFFHHNPAPQAHLAVQQSIEIAKSNSSFLTMQTSEVDKFLSSFTRIA